MTFCGKTSSLLDLPYLAHYSKSQTFVQKFNFDKTLTFSRVFHQNFFLTIFLVKLKLSTAKKSKTITFSRVFHSKKFDNFLGKSKLNFWTKSEDFEQCDLAQIFAWAALRLALMALMKIDW